MDRELHVRLCEEACRLGDGVQSHAKGLIYTVSMRVCGSRLVYSV